MSKRARHAKAKKSSDTTLATPAPAKAMSETALATRAETAAEAVPAAERITAVEGLRTASEPPPAAEPVPPSRPRAETPVAYATPIATAEATTDEIPRDEGSLAPVDLDSDFFASAPVHEAEPAHEPIEPERRPHPKLTRAAAERRAHLTRYVRIAVGAASALCLAALVKVAVARGDTTHVAHVAAARAPEVMAAVQPPVVRAPDPETVAVAEPVAAPETGPVAETVAGPVAETVAAPEAAPAPASDTASTPDPKAAASAKRASQQALERGKLVEAIEAGERSVSLDPTDAEAWLILGAAYQEKGDLPSARRSFKGCLEQGKRGPRGECAQMPH